MVNLNNEQIIRLFQLADIKLPEQPSSQDISKVIVELEKKLSTSAFLKSELNSENTPSILVVDDLEVSIHQLSILLTRCGYNVHIARSREEAIHQLKKHSYQYILLDLFLPDPEDGLSLIESISSSKNEDMKVIIMSGADDKKLINQCFLKGADEFVEKNPEWHINILNHIRQFEISKQGTIPQVTTSIEDDAKKIAAVKINSLYKISEINELEKEIRFLVNSGFTNIILDMNSITNIDSKGIGCLIFGYKLCADNDGCLKLYNVKAEINEVLTYVFLQNVMQSFKDKESALKSFK